MRNIKLNLEAFFRVVILLTFACYFLYIVWTGNIIYYVHPRIIPVIIFATILLFLIAIAMLSSIFRKANEKPHLKSLLIFILPLILMCITPAKTLNANDAVGKEIKLSRQVQIQQQPVQANSNNKLEFQNNKIIVEDSNFIQWMDELGGNYEKYQGKEIEIKGFVFKNESFDKMQFVAARYMMVCCTADAQVIGLMCNFENAPSLATDTWVNISGKIVIAEYKGEKIPIIQVEKLEKIEKPKNEYVYPY